MQLISDYYNVEALAEYLEQHPEHRSVTLQFPDDLIKDSSLIIRSLQSRFSAETMKFWVLADTAYSACCVDEVAAEHVHADLVVHFGDACLNAIQSLPVVYSFGTPFVDMPLVVENFRRAFPDLSSKICLMANAPFSKHLSQLYSILTCDLHYTNIIYSQINTSFVEKSPCNNTGYVRHPRGCGPGRRIWQQQHTARVRRHRRGCIARGAPSLPPDHASGPEVAVPVHSFSINPYL